MLLKHDYYYFSIKFLIMLRYFWIFYKLKDLDTLAYDDINPTVLSNLLRKRTQCRYRHRPKLFLETYLRFRYTFINSREHYIHPYWSYSKFISPWAIRIHIRQDYFYLLSNHLNGNIFEYNSAFTLTLTCNGIIHKSILKSLSLHNAHFSWYRDCCYIRWNNNHVKRLIYH